MKFAGISRPCWIDGLDVRADHAAGMPRFINVTLVPLAQPPGDDLDITPVPSGRR
jgi:hypothetical protein